MTRGLAVCLFQARIVLAVSAGWWLWRVRGAERTLCSMFPTSCAIGCTQTSRASEGSWWTQRGEASRLIYL